MLYQTLWCLALPHDNALAQFQRLRDACRQATARHPELGVALLFSGNAVWLLAECRRDQAGLTGLTQALQGTDSEALPNGVGAAAGMATSALPCAHPITLRALPPGECTVGYLDGEDCQSLGPADRPAAHRLAAFWRLWQQADRG